MSLIDRIDIAVSVLKAGESYPVDGIVLNVIAPNVISITGFTSWQIIENLSKANVIQDLQNLKLQVQDMMNVSPVLKDYITGKEIQFFINFDYGLGSIQICSEIKDELSWDRKLKD